jgi:hypothetical protein
MFLKAKVQKTSDNSEESVLASKGWIRWDLQDNNLILLGFY